MVAQEFCTELYMAFLRLQAPCQFPMALYQGPTY